MLEGLGYLALEIPTPDKESFQLGKEFGNNGQCSPTYFTVGNLVKYLQQLEQNGMSKEEILEKYVFFTAGACGPCRFGMYEAEYRLALKNSGFDGFRIVLIQQKGGLNQATVEAGLEMNLDLSFGILNAMLIGDIINDMAYQIRPYEIVPGETDRILEESITLMYQRMQNKNELKSNSLVKKLVDKIIPGDYLVKFANQLMGRYYLDALVEVQAKFATIKVDRLQVKPICKITGEFWAQTTDGDGNFNMFPFLEKESAQVMAEPIATWLLYMLHQAKNKTKDRKMLVTKKAKRSKILILRLAEKLFVREYNRMRKVCHNLPHALTNQIEMEELAHKFYNSRLSGGEGHLEVAKNIYYCSKSLSHMVISLKPFGCMPSTQSDGVQSAVMSHFKEMIFLPIETSGEGDVNAHSRVQMALGDAKAKARGEFKECLAKTGYQLEDIKNFVAKNPELQNPFYSIPHSPGVVGVAANFVLDVAKRMRKCRQPQTAAA